MLITNLCWNANILLEWSPRNPSLLDCLPKGKLLSLPPWWNKEQCQLFFSPDSQLWWPPGNFCCRYLQRVFCPITFDLLNYLRWTNGLNYFMSGSKTLGLRLSSYFFMGNKTASFLFFQMESSPVLFHCVFFVMHFLWQVIGVTFLGKCSHVSTSSNFEGQCHFWCLRIGFTEYLSSLYLHI